MKIEQHIRRKRLAQISLSNHAKSIILGSLLGNGTLICNATKNEKCVKVEIRHKKKEYLNWKTSFLNLIFSQGVSGCISFCTFSKKWIILSKVSEKLSKIHEVTHKKNKLKIRRTWLNHLKEMSLAVWWFDVGKNTKSGGVFCTDKFDDIKACLIISKYLQKVWNVSVFLSVKICKNRKYYRLCICRSELKKFFKIIIPHAPLIYDMFYKKILIVKNKDPFLQKRWISEIYDLLKHRENDETKEFFNQFRERYRDRKSVV